MPCQYFSPSEGGAQCFSVAMPKLTFGRGCLAEAGERAASWGMRRVVLFTDAYLRDGPYVASVRQALIAAGIQVEVFSEVRIEPDDATVMAAADFVKAGRFDGAVSVGGGSVMDTAKAALLYTAYPADFTDYFAPPIGAGVAVPGALLPHLACPTTCGTGSECTTASVIRLRAYNTKFVLGSPFLLPSEALVDPVCCETLPANVVASVGFDLLCHALECYTAKAYTGWPPTEPPSTRSLMQGANPWSDLAARRALEIVGEYLVRGVTDATDHAARDNLMWGATLAGMAFGNSGTHLPHAMSYGVTHLMRDITTPDYPPPSPFIPHGLSVIVSAPAIFKYTAAAAPQRHALAAGFLGADTRAAGPDDAGEVVAARIIEMMRATHVPNGLSGVGFDSSDVKALAASAVRQARAIANTPRATNLVDIENIYQAAIGYW